MTREEKIASYIKAKVLLTFEEWYKINELAFIVSNKRTPKDLYDEYVTEIIGE